MNHSTITVHINFSDPTKTSDNQFILVSENSVFQNKTHCLHLLYELQSTREKFSEG